MSRRQPPNLSQAGRNALPYIERGVREGLSANRIQSALEAAGMGVRRSELLDIVRNVRGIEQSGPRLRTVPGDRHPDPSRLPLALTKQLREYSFRVRVSGYNPDSGQREDRFVQISTNDLLTRDEIEARALGYASGPQENTSGGLFEPDEVQLMSGTRR